MAEYTTHYNLKKPARNENYNIDVANQNNDIIDEKLYGKVDKKAGKDLSTNDFTDEYKKKLDNLKNYDDSEVIKQITSFNKRAGKVEEANVEISKNVEVLQKEQTTQNENIEKNAEGIAQNKKDVDEELTKIKKENSLLKSQIPQGTASGNNIHLEDSSNMDFQWKLRGGSRQKTRSGKNVINVRTTVLSTYSSIDEDDWITIERTNTAETGDAFCNFFTKLTKELKTDTSYTIICEIKSVATTSGGYLSITNDSTGFAFDATTPSKPLAGLKAGDIIFNKLKTKSEFTDVTNLLRTFVAVNPQSSVKIVFRLSVIEGDVTADSFKYEPYGVSPSIDYQSKIKNVGDKINILNKDVVNATNNLRSNVLETGRRLIANNAGNYTYGAFKLGGRELLGETLGVHADIKTSSGNPRISIFAGNSSSLTKSLLGVVLSASGTGYITLPSSLSDELDTISAVLYVTTDTSVVAGTYVEYTNLKVQVGDGEVIYSDYKKANIQMTKCNENYGNAELLYNQMSDFYSAAVRKEIVDGKNCIVFNNTAFRGDKGFSGLHFNYKKNTRYVIRGKFRVYDTSITSGGDLWVMALNKDNASIGYSRAQAKGSEWIQFSFFTNINFSFDHIAFSYGTGTYWCLDMDSLEIYEGTSVREVPKSQVQTITFPLEEGQKLYEGSYLAADAIHNKRKQIVLTGNENIFESQLGTYQTFGIVISGIKQGTKLMSNYFTSYPTITDIKYKAGMTNNNAADRLYISNGESSKTEEFKAWLSQRLDEGIPVIIEYELATEEIIPYTPEQQKVIDTALHTYKNITNISVDNELATLYITYKKDIETMFNNQAKEYNERLSNIENLLNTTETSALLLDNLENDLEKEV